MPHSPITIAIDGLVATGKGTTAQGVAEQLGYLYLDTGAMYRAVTLYALRHDLIDASHEEKTTMMKDITLHYEQDASGTFAMFLNNENVEHEIRSTHVSMNIYKIANVQGIRDDLKIRQQAYGPQGGIVADGRDMGTIVFPDAALKFFLVCDTSVRAQRRLAQKKALGLDASLEDILTEIELRDTEDYLGPHAVNTQAEDAIVLDTTNYTIKGQIDYIVGMAKEILHQV